MVSSLQTALWFTILTWIVQAVPVAVPQSSTNHPHEAESLAPVRQRRAETISDYAPRSASCPADALVRPAAAGLSPEEAAYVVDRKSKAAASLEQWINGLPAFKDVQIVSPPTLGLSSSGGGYRALLAGAGVVKGMDSRENTDSRLSGLYQALTYHSGLSGGAWLLSSLAANDWRTVSTLTNELWRQAFADSLLFPSGITAPLIQAQIFVDVLEKDETGYDPTLTDTWGRLLSYQLYEGRIYDQNQNTLSSIIFKSSFQSHTVPYPIMTAILVPDGQCQPALNSPTVEMHPYEWGSWDSGVSAFANTYFLGTNLDNGQPPVGSECINGYDNLGFIAGTSSNIFTVACAAAGAGETANLTNAIAEASFGTSNVHLGDTSSPNRDLFATYPNPFRNLPGAGLVSGDAELKLTDGGLANQNNPIWPFIQPARAGTIDVLIVNDNSADVQSFPDGRAIIETYVQAQARGLSRMPAIPDAATFVQRNYNKQATFFGCNQPETLTIIYIPNAAYTYPSNQSTLKLEYSPEETDGMIQNGVNTIDQGGKEGFDVCIACIVLAKSKTTLPSLCSACLDAYCYRA